MTIDDFLSQFASTLGALILLLVSLLGILMLKDRKLARSLIAPVFALSFFLLTRWAMGWVSEESQKISNALRVVGVIFFAFALVRIVAVLLVDWVLHVQFQKESSKIIRDVISAALYFVAFAAVIRATTSIDLTATLATAGALSLVLGLALQDTLGNVFSGLAIQLEQPFRTGDWVSFGTTTGRVRDLGWRAMVLETRDHDLITVPNSVVTKLELHNHSRPVAWTALRVEVGLPYDCPPNVARSVLTAALTQVPEVLQNPAPKIRLKSFAESSITYELRYFIDVANWFMDAPDVNAAVGSAIWYSLKRAGISIPFPIRTVYMHQVEAASEDGVFAEAERMLADIDFLKPLDDDARRALARRMRVLHFGTGESIVRQGDAGETFYLVEQGEVSVRARGADDIERRVATLGPGAFFGEMSLLTGEPRAASVVSVKDSLLMAIDRDGFRDALQSNPDVARQLAEILSARSSQLQAATATSAAAAPVREPGRILGKLKELFGLT